MDKRTEGRTTPLEKEIRGVDFSGQDLHGYDFSGHSFVDCSFHKANLSHCNFEHTWCPHTDFSHANCMGTNFKRANLRFCNFTNANVKGANFYAAVLEDAVLEDMVADETTEYFHLQPPNNGAFIAYKKCVADRIVMLYIPEDSQRTSATMRSCRCEKAFVVSIRSFNGKKEYKEAQSTVDEDFYYEKGKWVYAENFNPNRWYDSTGGIHFWMTREEAMNY